jgi:hypothetical protein
MLYGVSDGGGRGTGYSYGLTSLYKKTGQAVSSRQCGHNLIINIYVYNNICNNKLPSLLPVALLGALLPAAAN